MGVDSVGKGIIFLSESLTKVAFKKPNKTKLEVLSGRESGSNGYGFNFPTFINFYSNNVNLFASQLNSRVNKPSSAEVQAEWRLPVQF